ncbi:Flavocytochrome YedZ [Thalassovita gelatinovora]|uniref:Protein-methionine-sulfoxide reductase heme-binding subunit MsrQ n=1 Tax=Thalassovita gelatinovora TaxID=53501 RepID=A0A0N7LV29_THAGE|nr:protein-methionine-sulfoxide reductase heme-binding subunit MsrQ [Thalassovita gelatinovora]QIZ80608.1 protein-methionine-sulfoxide reductase heme-binding subunit MsrQ [Thalassovita gelatinovora]CUH65146.1 Flavocytochrome YedZ [Thalassovita gelatinovora]SER19725.1 sulfoxide reductase heme-binding subunit YedZ [Thalassovita gelatinovora]
MYQMTDLINRTARKLPTWVIYVIGLVPIAYLFWQGWNGALGVDPVKALEHAYGEWALKLLIAGLAITPLRRYAGVNLLKFRRTLGVLAFSYVVAHLLIWALLDVQTLARVWADIVKRPYITIGMAAFVLMLPLALTSTNAAIRRLGQTWRKLHRLTYAVALLGAAHFIMVVKGVPVEPLIYLGVVVVLLTLRLKYRHRVRLA